MSPMLSMSNANAPEIPMRAAQITADQRVPAFIAKPPRSYARPLLGKCGRLDGVARQPRRRRIRLHVFDVLKRNDQQRTISLDDQLARSQRFGQFDPSRILVIGLLR